MFLSTLFSAVQRWRRSREATRMLHSLSDSSLRDIGLDRSGIKCPAEKELSNISRLCISVCD